jgi:uncharacterized lipoprotein YddW (UPF0748 family)
MRNGWCGFCSHGQFVSSDLIMALARSPQLSFPPIRLPLRWQKRRFFTIAIATWLVIVAFWQAPIVNPQATPIDNPTASRNLHATWMTHFGASLMYHTTRLDETIADLAKQNINTLYPAVWNHGHVMFSSETVQTAGGSSRNPWINLPLPGSDVMQGLVHQAHRQKMRLIPWFEYGLMIPRDADVLKQHPDWLTQTQANPTPAARSKNPWGAFRQAVIGHEQVWLNPFHPEVQTFLTNMILDVVQQYPVEGIQLDDHFGLPIDYGYDPYTTALYKADHAGNPPPTNPADPEWMRWRADRLTQLMQRISQGVKATRPGTIVSLSPNTADFAYRK